MIYHFLDQYHGFSMSAEAILSLLGNKLGSSPIVPVLDANPSLVSRFLVLLLLLLLLLQGGMPSARRRRRI
jgi:hypothetical protein